MKGINLIIENIRNIPEEKLRTIPLRYRTPNKKGFYPVGNLYLPYEINNKKKFIKYCVDNIKGSGLFALLHLYDGFKKNPVKIKIRREKNKIYFSLIDWGFLKKQKWFSTTK